MKISKGIVGAEVLLDTLGSKVEVPIDLSNKTFTECSEHYFAYRQNNNKDFIKGVIKGITNVIGDFKTNDVSHDFLNTLAGILSSSGYANTTVKYLISCFRRIVKWSSMYGAETSPSVSKQIKMAVNPYKVALKYEELVMISNYPIHLMKLRKDTRIAYERARDTFILACNLGQRWSDVSKITPENFENDTYRCYQQKTGNYAVVDIDKMSLDPHITKRILKKYDYTCPWQGSYRNLANTLKHFFKSIGFTDEVQYIEPIVGGQKAVKKYKWDIITMHSARRTFITLNSEKGISAQTIMRASGHASYGSFGRYVCA